MEFNIFNKNTKEIDKIKIGNKRGQIYINGKKMEKCQIENYIETWHYLNIYWYAATWEEIKTTLIKNKL